MLQAHLCEAVGQDGDHSMVLLGVPPEAVQGRIVGWRRTVHHSHKILLLCLQSNDQAVELLPDLDAMMMRDEVSCGAAAGGAGRPTHPSLTHGHSHTQTRAHTHIPTRARAPARTRTSITTAASIVPSIGCTQDAVMMQSPCCPHGVTCRFAGSVP